MSVLSTAILLGVGALLASTFPRDLLGGRPLAFSVGLIVVVLLGSALFTIRGYELAGSELLVRRLVWATRIPLQDLRSAWADPSAMKRSIRLFGNGGLFAFSGLFSNRKLGRYRAFATDPRNAVVLRFAARTIVVTPDAPQEFLSTLSLHCPQARVGERGGVYVLRRDDGDETHFLTATFWESEEAIRGFAGADVLKAKHYPEDREFLLELEPEVVHYTVIASG